jgi:hypothetical protein
MASRPAPLLSRLAPSNERGMILGMQQTFGGIARNGSGEIHVLRLSQFRRNGLLREPAKTAERDTELAFIRGLGTDDGVEAHDGRCGEGGGFEEGTTGGGGWSHGV